MEEEVNGRRDSLWNHTAGSYPAMICRSGEAGKPKGDFEYISYSETRSLLWNTFLTPTKWQHSKESHDPSWNAPHKMPCESSETNQPVERAVILPPPALIRTGSDCCASVLVCFPSPAARQELPCSGWPGWTSCAAPASPVPRGPSVLCALCCECPELHSSSGMASQHFHPQL